MGAPHWYTPPVVPEAQAARASNEYINDPLQDPSKVAANWDLAGKGSAPDKQNGATGWSPRLMNVNWANNNVKHQQNGQNGCEKQGGDVPWPYCSVAYIANTDSQWMTLTADNPNECKGSSGTILNKKEIPGDLGVVVEYDQRLYRTNNGQTGGSPENQGAGGGMPFTSRTMGAFIFTIVGLVLIGGLRTSRVAKATQRVNENL